MSYESWQTTILAVLAAVLLLQTIVLVAVALSILKVRRPIEALIASTHELLGIARHRAQRLDVTLERIGQVVQERSEQADVIAKELLAKSQIRAQAVDQLLCHLLREMEYVADEVERLFRKPLQEAHALRAGFRAGFESFFSRRQQTKNGPHS